MTLKQQVEEAKAKIVAAGLRVAAGTQIDEAGGFGYVSSVESIPCTYGHPRMEFVLRSKAVTP